MPTLPEPWPSFLAELDNILSRPAELHCLGGLVLAIAYGIPRPTGDLDYFKIEPFELLQEVEKLAGRESKLARKYKVYVQFAGGVTDLPEHHDERLVDLNLELRNVSLKVLEPYDLALSKLTRNNPKDREDVKYLAAKLRLSYKGLVERFEAEMKPWLPNVDRHQRTLTAVWQEYFLE